MKLKKEKDLLKEALQDLDRELKTLHSSKVQLEKKLGGTSSKLETIKTQQLKLRDLISYSMKKESELVKRKASIEEKTAAIEKKIEKVKTIGQELRGV
ncbi:MAG: hypothetical protein Q8R53_04900 [Nanoarchaeota archaeon]|nr:hypothetical protein [Nanoarchaeota archaeon]